MLLSVELRSPIKTFKILLRNIICRNNTERTSDLITNREFKPNTELHSRYSVDCVDILVGFWFHLNSGLSTGDNTSALLNLTRNLWFYIRMSFFFVQFSENVVTAATVNPLNKCFSEWNKSIKLHVINQLSRVRLVFDFQKKNCMFCLPHPLIDRVNLKRNNVSLSHNSDKRTERRSENRVI